METRIAEVDRSLFPTTDRWVFLDHAAVAPLPKPTVQAMMQYVEDLSVHGIASFAKWSPQVEAVRLLAAKAIGAKPTEVAFIPNTSMGISLVAEGFPFRPGDNVVTAEEEYPSNQYPWMNLHDRGVEVRRVPSRGNAISVDDLRAAMDSHTRLVTLSAVEFASGYRNALESIGEICRQKNIFFFVDAIQALGAIPMDVRELPIDALAADGHKWLLGPEGAGIFWIQSEWIDRLHPVGVGWNSVVAAADFSTIDFRLKPTASRWEGGTFNVAGIMGFGASWHLIEQFGIENVWRRILHLTDHLCDQAPRYGMELFSNRDTSHKSGIVSLIPKTESPQSVMKRCRESGIVVNVRGNRLRASPHFYNTIDEMDRFLTVAAGR